MISYHEALAIIQNTPSLPAEWVDLDKALHRVVATDIKSPADSPPFDNSAMDGYALCAEETAHASPENPILFPCCDVLPAGRTSDFFGEKTAIKIMTGAPLPAGYDTVIPVENAVCEAGVLRITAPLSHGLHVRYLGEDICKGASILTKGERITPHHIMVCATVGQKKIQVLCQPTFTLLSTGKEIVDSIGKPLKPGQIYNSNIPYLQNALTVDGFKSNYLGSFEDDSTTFQAKIKALLCADKAPHLIISTGAVSKGDFDFIPSALKSMGSTILFHRVGIRPGKPILCAKLGNSFYIGLPGNPISAIIGYLFFIKPLIQTLQGANLEPFLMANLDTPFIKKGPFRQFLKARAYLNSKSTLHVRLLKGQESSKVQPLLDVNAWVMLDEETTSINANHLVPIRLSGALTHEQ